MIAGVMDSVLAGSRRPEMTPSESNVRESTRVVTHELKSFSKRQDLVRSTSKRIAWTRTGMDTKFYLF